MNIIKEILGLFRRNTIVTPEDNDVLIVGKRKPGNSKTPQVNDALVTFKSIKDSIGGGVNASNTGAGSEVLKTPVVGSNLEFRTLRAGSNITLTQNADDVQIDASGGGGGYTPSDAYTIPGATIDFSVNAIGSLNGNQGTYTGWRMGRLFRIETPVSISALKMNIKSLSTNSPAKAYAALYKFNVTTKIWELRFQPTAEFDYSPTGVTGWQEARLAIPHALEPGLYMSVFLANNIGGTWGYSTSTSSGTYELIGHNLGGTSMYYGLVQTSGATYDYGSVAATLTSAQMVPAIYDVVDKFRVHFEIA